MIEVVKSIIVINDKFLLLKRSPKEKFFPGLWDFPGGKLKPGEDPVWGVIRETFEETALNIEPGEIVADFSFTNGELIHARVFSVKEFTGEVIISRDHTDFKWLTEEEMKDYSLTPATKIYFKKYP